MQLLNLSVMSTLFTMPSDPLARPFAWTDKNEVVRAVLSISQRRISFNRVVSAQQIIAYSLHALWLMQQHMCMWELPCPLPRVLDIQAHNYLKLVYSVFSRFDKYMQRDIVASN